MTVLMVPSSVLRGHVVSILLSPPFASQYFCCSVPSPRPNTLLLLSVPEGAVDVSLGYRVGDVICIIRFVFKCISTWPCREPCAPGAFP